MISYSVLIQKLVAVVLKLAMSAIGGDERARRRVVDILREEENADTAERRVDEAVREAKFGAR